MRPTSPTAVGVVLAAGLGTRIGADGNKAYVPLAGRSMVTWSVAAVAGVPEIARTVLVFRRGERETAERTMSNELPHCAIEFVEGGDTRHGSEWNVLQYLADDIDSGAVDLVLIHDGARPVATPGLMTTALATAHRHGGAIPGVRAYNVVALDPDGSIHGVPDELVRVQTPQAFRAKDLLRAYRCAEEDGFDGTDTSACVQRYTDVAVHVFAGAAQNLKVTFPTDVGVASHLLGALDPSPR
jgi:2-C-methyl-D-erythritol 4-phosphate cytidylyltransferase